MTWELRMVPPDRLTPEVLYDINRRHGLLHDDLNLTIPGLVALAQEATVYVVYTGDVQVATVIISRLITGTSAEIDLIPVTKFFRGRFKAQLQESVGPLIKNLPLLW